FLANQQMLAALQWANAEADRRGDDGPRYEVAHARGDGGHSDDHGGRLLPDVLRWLWQPGAAAPGGATDLMACTPGAAREQLRHACPTCGARSGPSAGTAGAPPRSTQVLVKERADDRDDLAGVRLEREMAGVVEVHLRVRDVALPRQR